MKFKIFIVEDDKVTAKILSYHLSLNPDNEVEVFHNGRDCLKSLHKQPDLICLDYYLPAENGDVIFAKIKDYDSSIPVVIVSGQNEIKKAVNLLKEGIYDYVVKDENTKDRLWNIINNLREKLALEKRLNSLESEVSCKYSFSESIKGESQAITSIFPLIKKAADSGLVVSITGETGTGKELVAKAIHYNSKRKKKPFVAINVAAIPKDLIESELFGHEKGAFTGAITRKIGKFEEANNGTLLLDEISDMDVYMQSKLLRVVQEQELTRVGGNQLIKLNVRLIVSSNKDLREEVKKGNFREDLFYRLMGITIHLKPLIERGNDVILLARHFIKEYCKANKIKNKKLSKEAINKLLSHDYPGNVRELKAIVELAVVMSDNEEINSDDIQINNNSILNDVLSSEMRLEDYNRAIVNHFLKKYNNKVRLVAKKLGIGKSTIYRMLKE